MRPGGAVRSLVLLGLGVLPTAAGPVCAAPALEAVAAVEVLSYDATGDGLVIYLKTTVPVPRFLCRVPSPTSSEAVIELPEATSRLQNAYVLDSPIVPEVRVESGSGQSAGLRIRFIVRAGRFSGIEQVGHGLLVRFEGTSGPGDGTGSLEAPEYKVGIGDKLEVAVFGHEDLDKIVEVRSDGTMNYPLIGDLPVAGKTAAQIDDEMTQRLAKDFLVDPQVSVDVREYRSQWVTVLGEVRTPGRYPLKQDMRVIDLLAEAGGATKEAGSEILITRRHEGNGGTRQIVVNREQLFSRDNQEANVPLRHGDIVALGEKEVFYIRGEVARPGAYVLESGMTVLKAISIAGGLSQFANRKDVEILRSGDTRVQEKIVVNLRAIENGKKEDIVLRPNDLIIVPRRIF